MSQQAWKAVLKAMGPHWEAHFAELEKKTHIESKDSWEEESKPFETEAIDRAKGCPDCGEKGEIRGHQTCQYPSNN